MTDAFPGETVQIPGEDQAYHTVVAKAALYDLPMYLERAGLSDGKLFVVSDDNPALIEPHVNYALASLKKYDRQAEHFTIKAGEENKSLSQVGDLIEQLSEAGATRKDIIVAMGGGVVGDLVGFAASIYNRGVPLVHLPTTLLAKVDSSIGGKTGVDHAGKNKTGSFYQPKLIVSAPEVLETLDQRVFTEGFGEVVKYGMLDASFLPILEEHASDLKEYSLEGTDFLVEVIKRCVKQKSDIIMDDPHEQKPTGRVLLNYGHTLGHGLEAAGGYTELLHGESVSIGMTYAAKLAVRLGLADDELVDRQTALLRAFDLPTEYKGAASLDDIMKHMAKDKKNLDAGEMRFVLPKAAGEMVVQKVDNLEVRASVEEFLAR